MMQSSMNKISLAGTTASAALAAYDDAVKCGDIDAFETAAHMLASVLRTPKVKAKPAGFEKEFLAALTMMKGVVEAGTTLPILQNVRLRTAKGVLVVYGTNLDVQMKLVIGGYTGPALDATVNLRTLIQVTRGAKTITFEPGEEGRDYLVVVANGAKATLPTLPSQDMPQMPFSPKETASMPAAWLRETLSFVEPAISKEETRYYLNGVYFHSRVEDGVNKLALVTTDGATLRYDAMACDYDLTQFILPRGALKPVLDNLAGAQTVRVSAHLEKDKVVKVRFEFAGGEVVSKAIDGCYPDFMRVIPKDTQHVIKISDVGGFQEVVGRLIGVSKEKSRAVSIRTEGGKVIGSAKSLVDGRSESDLPATADPETEVDADLNGSYLRGIVSAPGELRFASPNDPAIYRYDGKAERFAIIMPLRRS